jgi:hypothetical protein
VALRGDGESRPEHMTWHETNGRVTSNGQHVRAIVGFLICGLSTARICFWKSRRCYSAET